MTVTDGQPTSPTATPPRTDGLGAHPRIAELEAENAALRGALARKGLDAESTGRPHDDAIRRGWAGQASTTDRANLGAMETESEALRRADATLAESRAALREREEQLRLVLDSAADYAIFTTDLDRRVTSWNAGAERLLDGPRQRSSAARPT